MELKLKTGMEKCGYNGCSCFATHDILDFKVCKFHSVLIKEFIRSSISYNNLQIEVDDINKFLRQNEKFSLRNFMDKFNVSHCSARNYLNRYSRQGILKKEGRGWWLVVA